MGGALWRGLPSHSLELRHSWISLKKGDWYLALKADDAATEDAIFLIEHN